MTLLLGVLIGASIGFAACSLCVISKQADEKAKACSSHKKLVDACEALVFFCETAGLDAEPPAPTEAYELAKAALAEAEKE